MDPTTLGRATLTFALLVCAALVLVLGFFPSEGPGVLGNLRVLHWAHDAIAFLP